MPELKEFLKELDLSEELAEKDLKEVKDAFFDKFVNIDVLKKTPTVLGDDFVNSIVGKRLGGIETKALKAFGLSSSAAEGKKIEDLIEMGAESFKSKIAELEKTGAQGGDEKFQELQKKFEKASNELNQHKELLNQTKQTLEQKEQEWTSTLKNKTRDIHLRDIKTKIPVVDQPDPYKLRGVDAEISEKYAFELDDEEKLVVKDKSGNLVQNEKKTGFLSAEDVFKMEYQKAGLLKMTSGGTPPKKPTGGNGGSTPAPIPGRKLPESAVRNANRS